MRNAWWCLPILLCAAGATRAAAQGPPPRSQIGIGIGRSIPTGAFRSDTSGEGFAGGWVLTGHVTLRAPVRLERFRLRLDATFARNGANDKLNADLTNAFGQPSDEHMTLLGVAANAAYPLTRASRFGLSLFGGIGVWHSIVTANVGEASTHAGATKLGWQFGGEVTRGPMFLELRYVGIAAAKGYPAISFFPVSVGARVGKGMP